MEIDKKILDKISKLQALSASNHLGEVQAAQNQIKRLMEKHGITAEEVRAYHSQDKEYIQGTIQLGKKVIDAKYTLIAVLLQKYFFVSILVGNRNGAHITLIGQQKDVALASYIFDFLNSAIESEWKLFKRSSAYDGQRSARKSFFHGMAAGLSSKLMEERKQAQQWGLVIVDNIAERKAALTKFYPRTGTRRSTSAGSNYSAYSSGKSAGANLSINPGIAGSKKAVLQLR